MSLADDVDHLVFDTGPLSEFATAGWLGVLKAVVGARRALVPDVVVAELRAGAAQNSLIHAAIDAPWIEHRVLSSDVELREYARFAEFLVAGDRNRGEAAVLALASTVGGAAVVDDGAARKQAHRAGIPCKPTLSLLCESIRMGLLTVELTSALIDDLLAGTYRLPFGPGEFEGWATDNGLI